MQLTKLPDMCDPEEVEAIESSGQYVDDIKWSVWDARLTKAARREDIYFFRGKEGVRSDFEIQAPERSETCGS